VGRLGGEHEVIFKSENVTGRTKSFPLERQTPVIVNNGNGKKVKGEGGAFGGSEGAE